MTEPTREDDEAELAFYALVSDHVEAMVLANAAVNKICPACFAEEIFTSLAVKFTLHSRRLCSSDEEFLTKAAAVFSICLKESLNAAKIDEKFGPAQTHAGTNTPQ